MPNSLRRGFKLDTCVILIQICSFNLCLNLVSESGHVLISELFWLSYYRVLYKCLISSHEDVLCFKFQSLGSQGYADGIVDVWEDTGCRPEAKFTWDTQRNDNLEWNKKFRPKCRFDRLYYRPSDGLKAVYFELVGLERLENCRRFPSDHWGILAHFNKK